MQKDLFEKEELSRIRQLIEKRNDLQTELNRIGTELTEAVRSGSSISISHDGAVQLCRLPTGKHYIYKQTPPDHYLGYRQGRLQEMFPVELEMLYSAINHLRSLDGTIPNIS